MRALLVAILFCAACGVLSSGTGAPTNPPASGLGTILPLEDDEGLSWTPPFLLADPAHALSHPSALVEGDRIELWAQSDKGGQLTIVVARAESFEAGMGALEEALRAELPWEGGAVGSPSVVRSEEGELLLYVAAGKIGCAQLEQGHALARAAAPVYVDGNGGLVRSIALGQEGDRLRGFALVEGAAGRRLDALEGTVAGLRTALAGGDSGLRARATDFALPSWALALTEVGLRLDRTPAGRLREDLFFAATLPAPGDLGAVAAPTAIGTAARYLDEDAGVEPPLLVGTAPILSGPPAPGSATAVAYRGGVLVLYSAQSGPRSAIGVGRHP